MEMHEEGWVLVPSDWDPMTSDLQPLVDEVLVALEAVSPDQVRLIRSAIGVSAPEAGVY